MERLKRLLQAPAEVIREGLLAGAHAGDVRFELPLKKHVADGDVELTLEFTDQVCRGARLRGTRTYLSITRDFTNQADTDGIVIRRIMIIAYIRPAGVWGTRFLAEPRGTNSQLTINASCTVYDKMEIRSGPRCAGETWASLCTSFRQAGGVARQRP